jgi:hypothetical protein
MKYYDIHGIVKVATNVDGFFPKHFECGPQRSVDLEVVQDDFEFNPRGYKRVGSFFGGKNTVYFESLFYGKPIYKILIKNLEGKTKFRFTKISKKIFNVSKLVQVLLEIKLLQKGYTLIHAGGVSKDGKGYVLFGWPGVGKSSTIFGLSKTEGFEVFGDDVVILSRSGKMYSYPTKAGIFYKSENVGALDVPLVKRFELLFRYLIAKLPPFNRYIDVKMMVDLSNIVKVGDAAKLGRVYFLEHGQGKSRLNKGVAINKIVASTLQAFFDHYLSNKMFYAYCYINGFDPGYIEVGMRKILEKTVRDCLVIRSDKKDFHRYIK